MKLASDSCLTLLRHLIWWAFIFTRVIAGKSRAARMPRMAITTSNSRRVNASSTPGNAVRFTPRLVGFMLWVAPSLASDPPSARDDQEDNQQGSRKTNEPKPEPGSRPVALPFSLLPNPPESLLFLS